MTTVTSRPGGRRDQAKLEKRARIRTTALRLFQARGFEQVTIDEIAAQSDVAKGTFFNYYSTKATVLLEVYRDLADALHRDLATIRPRSVRARFRALARATERQIGSIGPLIDVLFAQVFAVAELTEADREVGERDRAVYRRWFDDARGQGEVRADLDSALAAEIVADLFSATVSAWVRGGRHGSLASVLATKVDLFLQGCLTRRRPRNPAAIALLLALGFSGPLAAQAGTSWVGDYRLGLDRTALAIEMSGRKVTVTRPPFMPAPETAPISVANGRVRFVIGSGAEAITFEGQFSQDRATGVVQAGERRGDFTLLKVARLEPTVVESYSGLYRAVDGRVLSIRHFAEFGSRLVLTDFRSLRVAPLYPRGRGDFVGGAGLFAPVFPTPFTVRFVGSRRVTLEDSTGHRIEAVKVPMTESPFEVKNGPTTISGTITLPPDPKPRPAVLMVHGSGPADRHWGPYADFFLSLGFAVVAWDKRGVGRSHGDWKAADFNDLAGDALAVLAHARRDPRIDSLRVGLWGISQAGWIEPLVARVGRVAFVIVHAGPGVTVADQGKQSLAYELRASGASETEVGEMLAYHELDDQVTRNGTGWDSLQAAYHRLEQRPWIWPPAPTDHWFRRFYRGIIDFDPIPAWRGVTAPVLALLGERDLVVHPNENRPRLEEAFRQAGLADAQVVVLPRANHLFMEAVTGSRNEYPRLNRFVPDYFPMLTDWLDRKLPTPRGTGRP